MKAIACDEVLLFYREINVHIKYYRFDNAKNLIHNLSKDIKDEETNLLDQLYKLFERVEYIINPHKKGKRCSSGSVISSSEVRRNISNQI